MSDDALKELIRWGALLSNCAFSLKGRDILDDDARATLKKCQAGWDEALSSFRAAKIAADSERRRAEMRHLDGVDLAVRTLKDAADTFRAMIDKASEAATEAENTDEETRG